MGLSEVEAGTSCGAAFAWVSADPDFEKHASRHKPMQETANVKSTLARNKDPSAKRSRRANVELSSHSKIQELWVKVTYGPGHSLLLFL